MSAPSGGTPRPVADPQAPGRPGARVAEAFTAAFGGQPAGRWWAPGRVNLIGEHTDYNDGFVLPLALQQGVAAAVRPRADRVLRVRSVQEGATVEVAYDAIGPGTVAGWAAYAAGVVWALEQRGHRLPGLDVLVDGDVPAGAGLSSSAALECAVAVACDDLAGLGLAPDALAVAARSAENEVVGAPTGGMDQMASMCSREGHLLFLDTRDSSVEHVPLDLERHGLALLVLDSRAPHAHAEGEYGERRRSCAQAARLLGVPALRDVALDELDEALGRLDDDLLRRRVRHVVTEDARVLAVARALRAGEDPRSVGPALDASQVSMREDFQITVPQVDLAAEAAVAAGAHGARMTGGGFGGCVLALVDAGAADAVAAAVAQAYAGAGFPAPSAFLAEPCRGAHRLDG